MTDLNKHQRASAKRAQALKNGIRTSNPRRERYWAWVAQRWLWKQNVLIRWAAGNWTYGAEVGESRTGILLSNG